MTEDQRTGLDDRIPPSGIRGITSDSDDTPTDGELQEQDIDPNRAGGGKKNDRNRGTVPMMPMTGGMQQGATTAASTGPGSQAPVAGIGGPGVTRAAAQPGPGTDPASIGMGAAGFAQPDSDDLFDEEDPTFVPRHGGRRANNRRSGGQTGMMAPGAPGAGGHGAGMGQAGTTAHLGANTPMGSVQPGFTSAAPAGGVPTAGAPGGVPTAGAPGGSFTGGAMAAGSTGPEGTGVAGTDAFGAQAAGSSDSARGEDGVWTGPTDRSVDHGGTWMQPGTGLPGGSTGGLHPGSTGGIPMGSTGGGTPVRDSLGSMPAGTSPVGGGTLPNAWNHNGGSSQPITTQPVPNGSSDWWGSTGSAPAPDAPTSPTGPTPTVTDNHWGSNPTGTGPTTPTGGGSLLMRPGDYRVRTEDVYSLAQQWNMLSQYVSEASRPATDSELGLAHKYTGVYDGMNARAENWSAGATKETARVSESLDQVAAGYDWIEGENSTVGRSINTMRAV